jgi:hypothetical protein
MAKAAKDDRLGADEEAWDLWSKSDSHESHNGETIPDLEQDRPGRGRVRKRMGDVLDRWAAKEREVGMRLEDSLPSRRARS